LREDDGSGNTLTIWAGDENAFAHMNTFIMRLENLESLELRGMSIVDHIGDLVQAVNRPKLKTLKLPLNGIESEYCLYFNHLLNFDTLLHLDLSSNWFGVPGLSRFKHTFKRFRQLKVLNLSNNKLCADEGNDNREFRDCLDAVAHSLEELLIMENQIENPEMISYLMEPISKMLNLKHLNISRNMLTGLGIVGLMQQIVTVQKPSGPIKL
jgi:hypothetical protein